VLIYNDFKTTTGFAQKNPLGKNPFHKPNLGADELLCRRIAAPGESFWIDPTGQTKAFIAIVGDSLCVVQPRPKKKEIILDNRRAPSGIYAA